MAERRSHDDDGRQEGSEIDIRSLGHGIWRRKAWILGPTLIAALAALAFVQVSAPYFRSSALVLIENREGAAPRSEAQRETALPDEQAVASQVQLIQSRDLVRSVVKSLDLASNQEFAASGGGFLATILKAVGLGGAEEAMPVSERVVEKVASNLTVYPVQGSRVIGLEFVSTDADLAAKSVNAFIDAYLDIQRDSKRETNKQASQYLSDEISTLRGRVGDAEERVEAFRAKAGLLVGANNTTVVASQLGDTSNQLSTSRTQQAESQAKADMIRSVLKQGRPAEALDIANSELVRALAQQRSQLAAQIASESRTLLPQHPRMRELSAQLEGLDIQIRNEAEKLARAFENEATTAGARVASLAQRLDGLKTTVATANNQEVQLRALERDARSQRDLLEQMLTRYRESSARENPDALLADARVISRGAAATEAYFPKKGPTVALTALAAFALSLFAAAAAEMFGGGRRPDEGRAIPPQTVADVPLLTRFETKDRTSEPAETASRVVAADRETKPGAGSDARAAPAEPDAPVAAETSPETAPAQDEAPAQDDAPARAEEIAHEETPAPATAQTPAEAPVSPVEPEASAPASDAPAIEQADAADLQPAEQEHAPVAAIASPLARATPIECADARIVATLARQLASMPVADGALRILATGAVSDLNVTDIASKIAATISESGRRVVSIDAGGGVPRGADGVQAPGLSDLLTGSATFAQAIHRDRGSRFHVVPQGAESFASLDPAAKSRLGVVLEALALTYDFVMLIAPSGPGAGEPFAALCNAAVLVSNASENDAATIEAHDRLKETGIDDVVVLLVSNGGGSPDGRSLEAA